ncbi:MAG: META domain-containing protein [Anaerolineae bacterium]
MKIFRIALLFLIVFLAAACGPISQALGQSSPSAAVNQQQPAATRWNLVSFTTGGIPAPVLSGAPITLEFGPNNTVSGSAGCNSYSGAYSVVQGNKITFGPMTQTQRACAVADAMQQEQRYLQALTSSSVYEVSGNQLKISYNNTDQLTFAKEGTAPPALPTAIPAASGTSTSVPAPAVSWKRQHFGTLWNVAFPQNWTVDDAGAQQGAIELQGPYGNHTYQVGITYPIGIDAASLDAWVQQQVGALPDTERAKVQVSDVTVAGAPAKLVLNMPTADGKERTHNVYIWKVGDVNQRLIVIAQVDAQPYDAQAAEKLLDDFLFQAR